MSIRQKLFLFVLFGSFAPLLLVFIISYSQQKQHLQKSVEETLSSQANQTIKAIHDRVLDARFTLSNFSELGVMRHVKTHDAFHLLEMDIDLFANSHPIFAEITALDANGDVVVTTTDSMLGKNIVEFKEFREAIKGETYISFPEYSSRADSYVSTQSHPIIAANGEIIGVLMGLLNWAFLETYLTDAKVLGQQQSENHVISVRSPINGTQLYQSPGANISLHIFVDKEIAFSSIKSLTVAYSTIGILTLSLVGILWWLISKSIGDRIANLTQGARELSKGNVAEQASKLKGEFLANMSHEVRTPINGVLGMAELMLQTDMDANQKRYASTILRSGKSLLSVVNDILDFSKIEAGKLDITKAPFNLRETVEDVTEMLAESAHRKNLELNIEMAPEAHVAYKGDASRIRQVLVNLINNAIKFTSSGEVKLTVKAHSIDDKLTTVRFDITDTGIGIPADKHNRVFQEFEQADGTTTREYGGTGLGLAISKKLTSLMGGEINFESEPNKGSNFWFTVQLQPLSDKLQERWLSSHTLQDKYILIVDDHQTNREILHEQLAHWGSHTIMANGPEHALQLIEDCHKQNRIIDVAIVDQQMPKMSGTELIQKIDTLWPENKTAFVILSSVNENRDKSSTLALAKYSHITKPARQKDLYNCLAAVLSDESAISSGTEFLNLRDTPLVGDVLLVEDSCNKDWRKSI